MRGVCVREVCVREVCVREVCHLHMRVYMGDVSSDHHREGGEADGHTGSWAVTNQDRR